MFLNLSINKGKKRCKNLKHIFHYLFDDQNTHECHHIKLNQIYLEKEKQIPEIYELLNRLHKLLSLQSRKEENVDYRWISINL